ncbi:hypothetical protein HPNQ4161_0510 [Helicobacter pylori NQ4161]|nr:hypothetical protein HPNQ4161_0510 [Helicobacter pylori NQ4161]
MHQHFVAQIIFKGVLMEYNGHDKLNGIFAWLFRRRVHA